MEATIRLVKICSTSDEREVGLQHTKIASDEGCLFIFDSPRLLKFWGRNTPQDLYVLGIDNGKVTESLRIEAWNENPVCSVNKHAMAMETVTDIPVGTELDFEGKVVRVV